MRASLKGLIQVCTVKREEIKKRGEESEEEAKSNSCRQHWVVKFVPVYIHVYIHECMCLLCLYGIYVQYVIYTCCFGV